MLNKLPLAVLFTFVIFFFICLFKKDHILWYFTGHNSTVEQISFSPMAIGPEGFFVHSDEYSSYHLRNLFVKVPSCYISQMNAEENDSFYSESFKCNKKQISIIIPSTSANEKSPLIPISDSVSNPAYDEFLKLSVIDRYRTLAQASSDDFSLLMSHQDLQEHKVKMLFKKMSFISTASLKLEYHEAQKEIGILLCNQKRGSAEYSRYLKGKTSPFIVIHFSNVDIDDETEMETIGKTCLSVER